MADGMIARIRELHRPHWLDESSLWSGQVWLVCHGCDEGAHAESPAGWPCRTADIVYSAGEIASREPHLPECPAGHGLTRAGDPVQSPAVFVSVKGKLMARRWGCDHIEPIPVEPIDPWPR